MYFRFISIALVTICPLLTRGADSAMGRNTIFSQSGQFVIAGNPLPASRVVVYGIDTNWNQLVPVGRSGSAPVPNATSTELDDVQAPLLQIDPSFLAASAERIKRAIWDRLYLNEKYQGKIYITLLRPTDPPQDILVMQMRNTQAGVWNYKLEIPEEVRSVKLLRALTHVILLEAANRHRTERLVEVPYWLREGMVEHLRVTSLKSFFFEREKRIAFTGRLNEEIASLKREINGAPLFDLEELSWPGTLPAGPGTERTFRWASHGLVAELLQLNGGGGSLGNMLRLLPRYENWQFAFLHAFQGYFRTLLDFEKWWALTVLELSESDDKSRALEAGDLLFRTELDVERWKRVTAMYLGARDANREWSVEECLVHLEDILQVPIEWQVDPEKPVLREEIGIRVLIEKMDFSLQVPVVEQRVARLFGLQLRAPDALVALIRDYRFALEKYLVEREAAYRPKSFKMQGAVSPVLAARRALDRLEQLDERKAELRVTLLSAPEQIADSRQ